MIESNFGYDYVTNILNKVDENPDDGYFSALSFKDSNELE
jgi:hypothetical protein